MRLLENFYLVRNEVVTEAEAEASKDQDSILHRSTRLLLQSQPCAHVVSPVNKSARPKTISTRSA
jgi:hypothetical protein